MNKINYLPFALLLFWAPAIALGSYDCSNPALCTVTCDGTNDQTDFLSAITGVNSGGTVSVGLGSCTISGTVTINKPLTLAGAGYAYTTLVGTASPMIDVAHGASGFARVTGIRFNGSGTTPIQLSGPISQVRVDHSAFGATAYGVYSVGTNGSVEGVIDHNEFINCDRCFIGVGTGTPAWSVDFNAVNGTFVAGGNHALFIEDNTITRDGSFSLTGNELHYSEQGMRTVFRYNVVDESAWPSQNCPWETHGNQTYYDETGHPPDNFRGQPISEIYNNSFILAGSPRVFAPRSGSVLIFNNTITISNPGSLSNLVRLIEEEAWSGEGRHFTDPGFDYIWPTEDMITNTFIWNNTVNGSPLTASHVGGSGFADCCGTYSDANYVINFNRDVWMHAPEASGGRTYYDDRPGASGRDADGTLVFTTEGANAYYPYTPYTYPHPLTIEPATGRLGGSVKIKGKARVK